MTKNKKRENSKARAWEKERRNRLNDSFTKLSKVLPCYDASKTLSKNEILEMAREAISDLAEKLNSFLSSDKSEKLNAKQRDDVIKKLQDRIKKLLVRNEQLSNLLKKTGIRIPNFYGSIKKRKSFQYSNKVSPEEAKKLQNELEKENQNGSPKTRRPKLTSDVKLKTIATNLRPKGQKITKRKTKKKPTNCLFIVSQPTVATNPCYFIAKNPAKASPTVLSSSLFVKTPIVSSSIKPSIFATNSVLPNLTPATFFIANGPIAPVLPPSQPVSVLPTLFSNPINNTSKFVMMSCSNKTALIKNRLTKETEDYGLNVRPIKPKTCFTKTVHVNKVPIPALTSKFNNHSCKHEKSSGVPTVLNKPSEQSLKNKVTKSVSDESNKSGLNKRSKEQIQNVAKKCKTDGVNEQNEKDKCTCTGNVENDTLAKANSNQESNLEPDKSGKEVVLNNAVNCEKGAKEKEIEDCISNLAQPVQKLVTSEQIDSGTKPVNRDDSKIEAETQQTKSAPIFAQTPNKSDDIPKESNSVGSNKNQIQSKTDELRSLEVNIHHSDLSNDIFAQLEVPPGCQNPESASPTAAFLLAFPLVSSGVKVTEVIGEENTHSQTGTPNLLQIGTMDTSKATLSNSESLTPSLLNLENFSFFSAKDNSFNLFSQPTGTSSGSSVGPNFNFAKNRIAENASKDQNVGLKRSGENKINNFTVGNMMNVEDQNKTNLYNNVRVAPRVDKNSSNQIQNAKISDVADKRLPNCNTIKPTSNQCNNVGIITPNTYTNCHVTPTFNYDQTVYQNKTKSNEPMIPIQSYRTDTYANYNKTTNSVYTSAGGNNFFYNSYGSEPAENRNNYDSLTCENFSEYRKQETMSAGFCNSSHVYPKEKQSMQIKEKPSVPVQNKPINWMTTPSNNSSYKPDYFLPAISRENNYNAGTTGTFNMVSNSYFNADYVTSQSEVRKTMDLSYPNFSSYQRTDNEENQFSWSPTKIPQFLDPAHALVSSTLPTLVGDLALNTPVLEQKIPKDRTRDNRRKIENYPNQNNQGNFLSVSQLVEHNREVTPGKVSGRRNSGNRSRVNTIPKPKRATGKTDSIKEISNCSGKTNSKSMGSIGMAGNLFYDQKQQTRGNQKFPSSYSAEALIGNQPNENLTKRNNPVQSFLTDNLLPYFPSVENAQDNSYMTGNQSYQANSFSHNFSNNYNANSFIPNACSTTYLPNNGLMQGSANHEYSGENFLPNNSGVEKKHFPKEDKNVSCKKVKKKITSEATLGSFDIPFLSMPGAINSPILPDDFHTTYLPPTTLYSCKNPLYTKAGVDIAPGALLPPLPPVSGSKLIQHPEISPSINSAGTSLTNFNLSTIFPEINKGPQNEAFPESRNRDYSSSRHFPVTSRQVPFASKPSFTFSSFGS